ncbi:unnamed protein product [Schistocephalus solidus]|uniref:Reverse transcriptase domain-containing protein n=1 Tax=Schistocephalus solidus TaxID=70667 RepID=A0A183TMW3_SCHSO|nr:unnamed protein product [Schistocephalus solidus]
MLPLTSSLKWTPTMTWICRLPYQTPSVPCSRFPGSDAIPPDIYKHGGPQLMAELTTLFQEMWRQGQVSQNFKDATIIFARNLLNHLNGHLEQSLLPENQCGFYRHRGTTDMIFATRQLQEKCQEMRRGTTDMIFAARQLQEKCQEMRTQTYTLAFVDLTKAFDAVNRDGLWKVMQKFGCPEIRGYGESL